MSPVAEPGLGVRIAEHILGHILSGAWAPGARVSSEAELARQFDASRMTVHHALRDLAQRGFIVRRQGAGSFVAPPSRYASQYDHLDVRDEILARGAVHRASVLVREQRAASADEAEAFRIRPGAMLFHALVVHYEDGRALEIEDRLLNPEMLPDCMEIDLAERSLFAALMMLRPLREGSETIRATLPSAEESAWLAIDETIPCLEIRRKTWTADTVVTTARILRTSSRRPMSGRILFLMTP